MRPGLGIDISRFTTIRIANPMVTSCAELQGDCNKYHAVQEDAKEAAEYCLGHEL